MIQRRIKALVYAVEVYGKGAKTEIIDFGYLDVGLHKKKQPIKGSFLSSIL
jgi:hypothetical protein